MTHLLPLLFAALALVLLLAGHLQLRAALARRPPAPEWPERFPSITVIRPIRGVDVEAAENTRALLDLQYPGELELLFVLDSEADPACALVREVIGAHPTRAARAEVVIAGAPAAGCTGKLNAMIVGLEQARGTLVAFNDSDTQPEPQVLSQLVAALLSEPKVGASFSPIYASARDALPGDVGYGLLVNAWYGPSVANTAQPDGGMPFIMGQLMVFRREAIASIGGLQCAQGQFVDDMFLGRQLVRAGWRNLVVDAPLRVVLGGMDLRLFLKTFRRWLLFSESGLPFSFTRPLWLRGIACWLAWLCLGWAVVARAPLAAGMAALAIAALVWTQVTLQRACHGPSIRARHLWVPALLPLLAAGVSLSARFSRSVDWRGRSYDLDPTAQLGARRPAQPQG